MANPNIGELFKDRRVVIGSAVVGLAAAAGIAFLVLGNGGGGTTDEVATDTPPPATSAANPASPVGAGANPAAPTPPRTAPAVAAAKPSGPPKVPTSFDSAPPGFYAGTGGTTTPLPNPGPPTTTGPGGFTDTATAKIPLAPIQPNIKAAAFRADPFISYRNPRVERTPAYEFIAPIRVASRPQPKVKPPTGIPEIDFGPLPYVPRRVAGILYNGQVSAILETGDPGQNSTVEIIQPGASVASGVANVGNLTVSLISPTQVILRADDGRTVSVPLTAAPVGSLPTGGGATGGAPAGGPPNVRGGVRGAPPVGGVE